MCVCACAGVYVCVQAWELRSRLTYMAPKAAWRCEHDMPVCDRRWHCCMMCYSIKIAKASCVHHGSNGRDPAMLIMHRAHHAHHASCRSCTS